MKNAQLAAMLARVADALELRGETGFRVLAYRKAARAISELGADIEELDAAGELRDVPGIGEGIARKVHEFLSTSRMQKYDEVTAGLPAGLFDILDIRGVGPKTTKLLFEQLKVTDVPGLKRALEGGLADGLPGMGKKKVEAILQSINIGTLTTERMYLEEAFEMADSLMTHMNGSRAVTRIACCGSLRRGVETIGDIDLLATGQDPSKVISHFVSHPSVRKQLSAGGTKASVLLETRGRLRQVDMRTVPDGIYGAALQYFTGSKDHNVALRARAQQRGLKISEYGVFRGEKSIAGRDEEDVYAAVGLPYIEPEMRENRGEIEAAAEGRLPDIVTERDIRSDLHVHSNASDGSSSIEEIAGACRKRGYSHVAIADHSVSVHYAGGLSPDKLLRQCDRVDRLNAAGRGFHILKASEVDITPSGGLDYRDDILARLDLVVASVHQGFNKNVTRRICDALAHPLVHAVAHPTGRLIGRRPGYDVDVNAVIEAAARHRKILEINAFYERLDLNDVWARKAMQAGVKLAINTDAHAVADLGWMRYGVLTARRAWLRRSDIVNCLGRRECLALLRSIRSGAG